MLRYHEPSPGTLETEMRASKGQSVSRGYLPAATAVIVCLGTLIYNMLTFSALASEPRIGTAIRNGFNGDALVAATYVLGGDVLRMIPGLQTLGDDTARAVATPLEEAIKGYPPAAVAVFFGNARSVAHSRMLWAHRLQPWLILIAALLWWRRPKPVHLRERLRA